MRTRLTAAVFVAAASAALLAQTSSQNEQPRPTFRAEANYVRVDMYALQDGQPVEDLTQVEIQILEDGVPQEISSFEHVRVRPAGPQETRVEPGTVEESRQAARDPRARVFVIFLDTYHVQTDGSHNMRLPLARFLDRVVGQDDLVAVMTPEMSAAQLSFARKTAVVSGMMQDDWTWGRREALNLQDPKEERYEVCYPPHERGTAGVAQEMIERRREKLTLDALDDLVTHLRGLRDERTAVLTVSEGWRLFGENVTLARGLWEGRTRRDPDGRDPLWIDPEGKLRRGPDPRQGYDGSGPASMAECDADRLALAQLDNGYRFRALLDRANRANVSFYPVYPRGLAPFDAPIGPRPPPPPSVDARNLAARHDALRELATNTDGLAVLNTNDIEGAMRRIVSDLTSYYLIGYYSSNTKLDGRFREIRVRVTRPGVLVRARRGYRGPTADDLVTAAAGEKNTPPASAVSRAFDSVATVSDRSGFMIRTSAWTPIGAGDRAAAAVWIVGELDHRVRRNLAWSGGATADVVVVSATGEEVVSKAIDIPAGRGEFAVRVPDGGGVAPGEYAVRIRVRPKHADGLPVSDTARVIVPERGRRLGEAVMWRRGPTTGPRYAMTADPRFRRSDRIRLEHATTAAGEATARMLDRAGNPFAVPVEVAERQDESGEFRWIIAEAALAPFAPGDYAIELTLDESTVVTAFKVVP